MGLRPSRFALQASRDKPGFGPQALVSHHRFNVLQINQNMILGLLMLLLPVCIYMASLPFTGKLNKCVRAPYRIAGGVIVIGGGTTSLYLASYIGDQGGIAAYFFQILVICVFASVALITLASNYFLNKQDRN